MNARSARLQVRVDRLVVTGLDPRLRRSTDESFCMTLAALLRERPPPGLLNRGGFVARLAGPGLESGEPRDLGRGAAHAVFEALNRAREKRR